MTMQETKQKRKQSTKKYDAVAKKIRKLLSASAQTFIPELCEALREDWFIEFTHEQLKSVKEARDNIRDKVLEDWSYEHGGRYSEDNVWSDRTIQVCFPDWVKNPILQTDDKLEHMKRMNEAKMAKKIAISEREKQKLEEVATKLPDNVIIPKPPEPKFEDRWSEVDKEEVDKELHALGMGKFGNTGKSLRELYGDITESSAKLFEALTRRDDMPDESDDLIVDYIKPTREFRRSLMLEFDEIQRTRLHNWLHYTSAAIEDMMQIISEVKDK